MAVFLISSMAGAFAGCSSTSYGYVHEAKGVQKGGVVTGVNGGMSMNVSTDVCGLNDSLLTTELCNR